MWMSDLWTHVFEMGKALPPRTDFVCPDACWRSDEERADAMTVDINELNQKWVERSGEQSMRAMGDRQELAKDFAGSHDGQYSSSKSNVAPAWECYPPIVDKDAYNFALAYQWPKLPNTDTRGEAEKTNVVYGQIVGWLQRTVITPAELMLGRKIDLSQVLHFPIPELLEVYRKLVRDSGIPYLVPTRHMLAMMEGVLADHVPGDEGGMALGARCGNVNAILAHSLLEASYGPEPVVQPTIAAHRGMWCRKSPAPTNSCRLPYACVWWGNPGSWGTLLSIPSQLERNCCEVLERLRVPGGGLAVLAADPGAIASSMSVSLYTLFEAIPRDNSKAFYSMKESGPFNVGSLAPPDAEVFFPAVVRNIGQDVAAQRVVLRGDRVQSE